MKSRPQHQREISGILNTAKQNKQHYIILFLQSKHDHTQTTQRFIQHRSINATDSEHVRPSFVPSTHETSLRFSCTVQTIRDSGQPNLLNQDKFHRSKIQIEFPLLRNVQRTRTGNWPQVPVSAAAARGAALSPVSFPPGTSRPREPRLSRRWGSLRTGRSIINLSWHPDVFHTPVALSRCRRDTKKERSLGYSQ